VVFVDTSVWIAASRKPESKIARTLQELLDADEVGIALPVRIEFVAAAPRRHRTHLRRALAALPLSVPTEETWHTIESWAARARDAGYSLGIPDLLIAALASELVGLVWSLAKDFEAMEKLGFVQLYSPP